jgi:hypothetical protein
MKKLTILIVILSFAGCAYSFGQISSEISIIPFLNDTKFYIDQIENDYYIINKLELDLVSEGNIKSTPVKLYNNQLYKILLFGETGKILDIDLKISKKEGDNWITVKEVNNPTNVLNTEFKPDTNSFYEFEISASKFAPGYTVGRYCLIISYE